MIAFYIYKITTGNYIYDPEEEYYLRIYMGCFAANECLKLPVNKDVLYTLFDVFYFGFWTRSFRLRNLDVCILTPLRLPSLFNVLTLTDF